MRHRLHTARYQHVLKRPPRPGPGRTRSAITAAATMVLLTAVLLAVAPAAQSATPTGGKGGTTSARAAAASLASGRSVVNSPGPLTSITISPDLNCAVHHIGDSSGEWFGETACGTFVATGGKIYGPASVPAGGNVVGAPGYTPYTPVSQTGPTGTGTAASPFTIVTVVTLGTSGLQVTETDQYVTGQETYRTDVVLSKTAGAAVSANIYRAGDCFLQNSDVGLGAVNGSAITCKALPTSVNPNRIEQLFPLTTGSRYIEAFYADVWAAIGTQNPLPNTCRCAEQIDNGIGLSWSVTLAAGAASTTISNLTAFSPLGAQPLSVSKTADIGSVAPSASDGYTIKVSNPGAVPATLSSITDTLPAGFTYTAGSTTGVTTANPTISGSTLTWNGSFTVPAATSTPGTVTLHFGVKVASTPGTYLNNATAAGTGLTVVASGPTAPVQVTTTTNHPTSCVVTAVRSGPPAQQDVTVRDADGIASISNVHVINGSVHVPTFTSGNPGPLVLTATKADQSTRTFWEFDVTDSLGATTHCV